LRLEHFALNVLTQDGFSPPSPVPGKSLSGSNVSPKLGALYRLTPQWSWFGNLASGFRAPNAAQVNGFTENPTPTTFVKLLANPDLVPETSRNLELGVRGRMDRLSLDAAAFVGDFQHLIVDKKPLGGKGVSGDPLLFQTVNVDSARIQGFELKGQIDWGDLMGITVRTPFSWGQASGRNRATAAPLNSIDPAKLMLGLTLQAAQWELKLDATQHAAKTSGELESPYLAKPVNPPRVLQFTVPQATTLDLNLHWRVRRDLRANLGVANLTNRKFWLWSDVQGLAATSSVLDAYTQPGRHLNVSVVMDY
jgi:hemoglobin/transferrin/lactoferrin receptor protein